MTSVGKAGHCQKYGGKYRWMETFRYRQLIVYQISTSLQALVTSSGQSGQFQIHWRTIMEIQKAGKLMFGDREVGSSVSPLSCIFKDYMKTLAITNQNHKHLVSAVVRELCHFIQNSY